MTSHVLQDAIKAHEGFLTAQPEQYRFILPLLRLLAEGKPAEPRHLASVAQCALEEIQAVVPSSDAEVDQAGNLAGWGLSLVPTPHQFHLDEHILSTWCALDALVFPNMLERTAEARLHVSGNRQDHQPDRHAHARFLASQRLARSCRSGHRGQTPTFVMSEEAFACRDTSL